MEETAPSPEKTSVNNIEFTLFLILILLLMSNNHIFDSHFNLLDNQVNKMQSILETLTATKEGLKATVASTQNS